MSARYLYAMRVHADRIDAPVEIVDSTGTLIARVVPDGLLHDLPAALKIAPGPLSLRCPVKAWAMLSTVEVDSERTLTLEDLFSDRSLQLHITTPAGAEDAG